MINAFACHAVAPSSNSRINHAFWAELGDHLYPWWLVCNTHNGATIIKATCFCFLGAVEIVLAMFHGSSDGGDLGGDAFEQG